MKTCSGFAELISFADNYVALFDNQTDAARSGNHIEERLAAFGLRIAPEKSAVLCFDGSLLQGRGKQGETPPTLTFLGFVHYLTKGRNGSLTVAWRPSVNARERFVRKSKEWLRAYLHVPVREQQAHLGRMLNGHYQYF